MKSAARWDQMPPEFWHYVRILSEHLGYSRRKVVLRHNSVAIKQGLVSLGLSTVPLESSQETLISISDLVEYFEFRADLIEDVIAKNLQNAAEAKRLFERIAGEYTTGYTLQLKSGVENARLYEVIGGIPAVAPYNKQKGDKRDIDFLTATSNILISHYLQGDEFDPDPRKVPAFTEDGVVVGSMSRRMDGAFPECVNPVALWEFKCYYYTTTFGSKISDAVYIADLDGYERSDAEEQTGIPIQLTLFIDAYSTWMEQGKSYLCRIVDLLQRGAIDNLVVGAEVETAIPSIVAEWRIALASRDE